MVRLMLPQAGENLSCQRWKLTYMGGMIPHGSWNFLPLMRQR